MSFSSKNIVATVVLAIVGFFLAPMIFSPDNINIAMAIGIIIGAIVIMALQTNSSEEVSGDEEFVTTTLYVGNLPYKSNEDAIQDHFEKIVDKGRR